MAAKQQISGVILAGGKGSRIQGQDKGLIQYQGSRMIEHAINYLKPQVKQVLINANRNLDSYKKYQLPLVKDLISGFAGPLAGIHAALTQLNTEFLFTMPCDSPNLPEELVNQLFIRLQQTNASIVIPYDGNRLQPVCLLIKKQMLPGLTSFLIHSPSKKVLDWVMPNEPAILSLDAAEAFNNLNTKEDFKAQKKLPILGIIAKSGTGKTSLLEKLIPLLAQKGLRVGIIKHSHHQIEVDKPGKDSYRLRQAGAKQAILTSDKKTAIMLEHNQPLDFNSLLTYFDKNQLDLVLLEGFKNDVVDKILLIRESHNKHDFNLNDPNIVAIATDNPQYCNSMTCLNINDIEQIADFILKATMLSSD